MPNWGVIPSIRVHDLAAALDCYELALGFTVLRGDATTGNCALQRGDARVMIEGPGEFYSPAYNEAIRRRLRSRSSMALYIEAADLEALYEHVQAVGLAVVDPLAARPWGQTEFTVEDLDGHWLTFWKSPHTAADASA